MLESFIEYDLLKNLAFTGGIKYEYQRLFTDSRSRKM